LQSKIQNIKSESFITIVSNEIYKAKQTMQLTCDKTELGRY